MHRMPTSFFEDVCNSPPTRLFELDQWTISCPSCPHPSYLIVYLVFFFIFFCVSRPFPGA